MNSRHEPAHELTLREILVIEDDPAFLQLRCPATGLHLWPSIRLVFLRLVMSDLLYGTALFGTETLKAPRLSSSAKLARAWLHNARHWPHEAHPVLIMTSGAGNFKLDGRWFNRLSDYFAGAVDARTLVVEEYGQTSWPFPRHREGVLFHQPLRLRSKLAERVSGRLRPSAAAAELVDLARRRAHGLLGWELGDERAAWLTQFLQARIAGLPALVSGYETLFRRAHTKLALVEEGCYGGHLAAVIAAARRSGVVTAEYQHGAVSAGHDAYNFAPTLVADSGYRQTLPDYLLSYGAWWNEQITAPVTKLAIGHPHHAETSKGAARNDGARPDILVLGDGVETDLYLALAQAISKWHVKGRVVFRPHPLERSRVTRLLGRESGFGAVVVDTNPDIYASFATAAAAVSEVSTGLFEAIGFVDRVFIWDTAKARFAYPTHPFQRFLNSDELCEMMRDPASGRVPEEKIQSIWAPGWKENYRRFVSGVLAQ